ncbi:MAG: hypothetical protein AAB964_02185 [Patescibacteria group bacterium]
MAPKIVKIVNSCSECPNYGYLSGGRHECRLVGHMVLDNAVVAPFCPLADYPSQMIANMQTTILGLRKPLEYGFGLALLTHVAAKLKLNLRTNRSGIMIPFNKDCEVYLGLDYIRGIEVNPFEITFVGSRGSLFKLSPDADPPLLRERIDFAGNTWRHHQLH